MTLNNEPRMRDWCPRAKIGDFEALLFGVCTIYECKPKVRFTLSPIFQIESLLGR